MITPPRPRSSRRSTSAPAGPRPRVLLVDDDPHITAALRRQLRSRYQTTSAEGALDALAIVEATEEPFAAVVSDLRMPGMGGLRFLEEMARLRPDTTRLLLTGYADVDSAIDALNGGHVFRFLCKPCDHDTLVHALDDAVDQHRLVNSERELLQRTLKGSIDALLETLALANPPAFSRALRVRSLTSELLEALQAPDRWHVETAAMLSQLGAVTLPNETAAVLHRGGSLTATEREMVARIPSLTLQLLGDIPRLEEVREAIAGLVETRVEAERLPLGARVLRATLAFDELDAMGLSLDAILMTLQDEVPHQDREVVDALIAIRGGGQLGTIVEVPLRGLRVGMVLRTDVVTTDDLLLVGRGQTVSENLLARISNFENRLDLESVVEVKTP